jgi:tRNA 2-thiocytidine biosynthesis protein TtcA
MGFDPDNNEKLSHLEKYFKKNNCEYYIEKTDIGPLAHSEINKRNPCFLCSRIRRKRIFELAEEHGCNKIAYGHHKDDIIETLMLNIFYGREISTMLPYQKFFNGQYYIMRPFVYVWESVLKKYAREQHFPTFSNKCPTGKTSKRQYVKEVLNKLEKENKSVSIKENIFKSLKHVKPDYLWQFK